MDDFPLPFWRDVFAAGGADLALAPCGDEYYESLRPKSRSMVRQADRRYSFRTFPINEHLLDVQALNLSKTETSFGPTHGFFNQPVGRQAEWQLCSVHTDWWWGGFDTEGVLRGYCRLVRMNELAIIWHIFSHAEGAVGVQNGLIAHMAIGCGARFIAYHVMDVGGEGREGFKRRAGFSTHHVEIRTHLAASGSR